MKTAYVSLTLAAAILLAVCSGCKSEPQGNFVPKTEQELDAMDARNSEAGKLFLAGDYRGADKILRELAAERTVSSPLFDLERVSILLMEGKEAEAHDLMMRVRDETDTLFDLKLEEKAQSLWHGEQNKVFKGDVHERATLYAFLAMSFMSRGNYEDALRCVKNGLLADSDSQEAKYTSDYALLQYLGSLCCARLNQPADAEAYRKEMEKSLRERGLPLPVGESRNCFSALGTDMPNTLLVFWVGVPPSFERGGEYGEIRHPIPGKYPYDALAVSISRGGAVTAPPRLGDVNFQATTRGGRMMDTVLADKAAVKQATELSRNILLVAGTGLIVAGANCMSSAPLGISLMGAGGGCLIVGGTVHVIGTMMNPEADVRFWKNLPCELLIVPLNLPAGRHDVFVSGYLKSDVTAHAAYSVTVDPEKSVNVIHLPLMHQGADGAAAVEATQGQLRNQAVADAEAAPMGKELSVK